MRAVIFFLVVLAPQISLAASFDAAVRREVLMRVGDLIEENYVYAVMAGEVADEVRGWADDPAIMQGGDESLFASLLTRRLSESDAHFSVSWSNPASQSDALESSSYMPAEDLELGLRRRNYGFDAVERLPGNVGYLKMSFFADFDRDAEVTPAPRRTAEAAMAFLQETNAMIIDLRQNGGGAPAMVHLILSHFLSEEPLLINKFFERAGDQTVEFYSFEEIANKRRPGAPLFVLTSARTGSAAEEFAYDVQTHKLGVVVGERSAGAANPGDFFDAGEGFSIFISTGAAINPITGTNWEGDGVAPQEAVNAADALDRAYELALNAILESGTLSPYERRETRWTNDRLLADKAGAALSRDEMMRYVGDYGGHGIVIEDGALFYKRARRPRRRLVPLGDHLFALDSGDAETRIKFQFGANENATLMRLEGVDGRQTSFERDDEGG